MNWATIAVKFRTENSIADNERLLLLDSTPKGLCGAKVMWNRIIAAVAACALTAGTVAAQTVTSQGDAGLQTPPGAAPKEPAVGEQGQSLTMTIPPPAELMGKEVIGADGEELGKVVDVVGRDGLPEHVVIATATEGGNGKEIAIEISKVQVRTDSAQLHAADLTRAELDALPPFEYQDGMTALGRDGQAPKSDAQ